MKICRKCNSSFACSVVIEGKKKNLQNRKFCLTCSPFGKHNTKKDPDKPTVRGCGPYSTWTKNTKEKSRQYTRERGNKLKQKLIDLKGGKCQFCGYCKCSRALSFHHRNPENKEFALDSRIIRGTKWTKVLEEVEKCDLLCLNCHMETEEKLSK